jgi:hypothetical protein
VSWFESDGGYVDAVGDLALIGDKWGPSIGLFQVRSLRHPEDFPFPDTLRIAELLRASTFNAQAAWEISEHGTDWSKWSVYRSGKYLERLGQDFDLRTGHERAALWNS